MSRYDYGDDDVAVLVCSMDSYVRKMHRRSRIPTHVSAFSWHERMSELLPNHEGRLLEHIRMNRNCFHKLCTLFTVQNCIQETHTLMVQEQLMMFLTMVAHKDSVEAKFYN